MPSKTLSGLRAEIEGTLLELSTGQLERVKSFTAFLAQQGSLPLVATPSESTDNEGEKGPGAHDPQTPGGGDEAAEDGVAGDEIAEDDSNMASLAWMLRLLFGDAALPEGGVMAASDLQHRHLSDVPLIPQQQTEWCWAATTHMILAYHGAEGFGADSSTAQLDVVRSVEPLLRAGVPARRLNITGWPPFETLGFEAVALSNPQALSQEQVQAELDAERPFAISWHYPGQGGHMLVIVGYVWVGETLWLVAHDPWPAGDEGGDSSLVSYEHYIQGLAGTWRTYYRVQPNDTSRDISKDGTS